MPISAQFLAVQRARALSDMTELCTIERNGTPTVNDMGESTPGWASIGTNVPCRLVPVQSLSARERERLSSIGQLTPWLLVVPHTQEIASRDRVVIGTRRFDVALVMGPHTDETRRRALLDEAG